MAKRSFSCQLFMLYTSLAILQDYNATAGLLSQYALPAKDPVSRMDMICFVALVG